jgi:hypothetical protein
VDCSEESKDSKHAAHHRTAMENFSRELKSRIPFGSDDAGYNNKSHSAQLTDLKRLVPDLVQSADSRSPIIALEGGNVDRGMIWGNELPKSKLWISVTSKSDKVPHRSVKETASTIAYKAFEAVDKALFP